MNEISGESFANQYYVFSLLIFSIWVCFFYRFLNILFEKLFLKWFRMGRYDSDRENTEYFKYIMEGTAVSLLFISLVVKKNLLKWTCGLFFKF